MAPTTSGVRSRAKEALKQSPIPCLRNLLIEETLGDVTLQGSVTSYYLKQLAQETIMAVLDQRRLHNEVQVVRA